HDDRVTSETFRPDDGGVGDLQPVEDVAEEDVCVAVQFTTENRDLDCGVLQRSVSEQQDVVIAHGPIVAAAARMRLAERQSAGQELGACPAAAGERPCLIGWLTLRYPS
ncbi:MAG: hypothetical protein QOH29_2145, partial [Actinomycetota bacterium]|nr:hypothetical protein [Actinomycetota bacterium]